MKVNNDITFNNPRLVKMGARARNINMPESDNPFRKGCLYANEGYTLDWSRGWNFMDKTIRNRDKTKSS